MTDFFYSESRAALPRIGDADAVERGLADWAERCARLEDVTAAAVGALAENPGVRPLLAAILGNSPFLTHCVLSDVAFFAKLVAGDPGVVLGEVLRRLKADVAPLVERDRVMAELRIARRQVALLVAIADLTGYWALDDILAALSDFADTAIATAVSHLLLQVADRGELSLPTPDEPQRECGYVVLAMGKLGARELNYSSDVDLIVLFD
ncbi:MAG: bifunctional [glutamine synthetase] adenylyltransferase/[glutamine synthetase]-adenylyl-L-tyrosine phosphorylase, partial [Pseudomonadota bacterium]